MRRTPVFRSPALRLRAPGDPTRGAMDTTLGTGRSALYNPVPRRLRGPLCGGEARACQRDQNAVAPQPPYALFLYCLHLFTYVYNRIMQITFRIDERLDAALRARSGEEGIHLKARELLETHLYLLEVELRSLAHMFSAAEAALIADSINGWLIQPQTVALLWANVTEAIEVERLDQKWAVDKEALIKKLRSLSYGQTLALVDALERWWRQPEGVRREDFARVGLVCKE